METKTYVIAIKSDREKVVGNDWLVKLHDVAGLKVQGGTSEQVRVIADQNAIRRVRQLLDDNFIIEQELFRKF